MDRCVREKEGCLIIWKVGPTVNTNRDLKRSGFRGEDQELSINIPSLM